MAKCNTQAVGKTSEELACQFLINQGMRMLTRNYRSCQGEIDLIMQDRDYVVFVEVRSRTNSNFETLYESINYLKQQKIIKTAIHYLQTSHLFDKHATRFDVIGIINDKIEWIKDAFFIENF